MGHSSLVKFPKEAGKELLEKNEVQKKEEESEDTDAVQDKPPAKATNGVYGKTPNC